MKRNEACDDAHTALSSRRATAVINYLAIVLALARDQAMNPESLVSWVHRHYDDRGLYVERLSFDERPRLTQVAEEFMHGRELVYGTSQRCWLPDSATIEVRTQLPYWDSAPESFFFFDVTPEQFFSYARGLAQRHASRLGVDLKIWLEGHTEVAHFREAPGDADPAIAILMSRLSDKTWLESRLIADWGGASMVLDGEVHDLVGQRALIAWKGSSRVGYAVFEELASGTVEVLALQAVVPGDGVGTALVEALAAQGRRLRVATTNDNLPAIRFYLRRGFRLVDVRRDAAVRSRTVKPAIPSTGVFDIPIYDEVVLERPSPV